MVSVTIKIQPLLSVFRVMRPLLHFKNKKYCHKKTCLNVLIWCQNMTHSNFTFHNNKRNVTYENFKLWYLEFGKWHSIDWPLYESQILNHLINMIFLRWKFCDSQPLNLYSLRLFSFNGYLILCSIVSYLLYKKSFFFFRSWKILKTFIWKNILMRKR